MTKPNKLPRTLLAEIGRIATTWAHIEQELILHASAMAAQDTDGEPVENLRSDFKRLREKWYALAVKNFLEPAVVKKMQAINMTLAARSKIRGYTMHGVWSVTKRGSYRVEWWEQRKSLEPWAQDFNLAELRHVGEEFAAILAQLCAFASG